MTSAEPSQIVYTDGVCYQNQDPGPGGWAYVAVIDGKEREGNGEQANTTNMRMQLTAAVNGLEATEPGNSVILYTSSEVVHQAMTQWIHKWVHNGWRNSNGQPVNNQDLWATLHTLASARNVQWKWLHDDADLALADNPRVHRVHALAYGALHHVAAGPVEEPENRTVRDEHADAPDTEQELPLNRADRQRALAAECQALQLRWTQLHEDVVQLDQEWQHLLDIVKARVEAAQLGHSLDWTDGAFMFVNLGKHAAHLSDLSEEALQICDEYAGTLQRALDA